MNNIGRVDIDGVFICVEHAAASDVSGDKFLDDRLADRQRRHCGVAFLIPVPRITCGQCGEETVCRVSSGVEVPTGCAHCDNNWRVGYRDTHIVHRSQTAPAAAARP